ncbi:MAG: hypothetical protein IIZ39_12020 [Blautia sp.]|nr:hypothetical protein [Blautia sp.]
MDFDGVSGKDKLEVYEKESGEGYDTGLISFFVNGQEAGSYDATADRLESEDYELVKTQEGEAFLILDASQGDAYSTFLLFSYEDGRFTCCLKGDDVIQSKAYLTDSTYIRFEKGEGDRADEFLVNCFHESQSLGQHQSIIRYMPKYHCVYKRSRVYKTKLTSNREVLTVARKTPAYEHCSKGRRAFYFEKGDKVKVSKFYDNPNRFRIYIKRISDGKAGWVDGIKNNSDRKLFQGVEYEHLYQ